MRIGFFTDSYLPSRDGVATSIESCAKELQLMGHQVIIVAPSHRIKDNKKNIYRLASIHILKEPDVWVGLEIPQLNLFKVAALDFDIIHGHSGGPISFLGWQLAKMHNIPFVETYHTLWKYYTHYFPFHYFIKAWMFKNISKSFGNECDALLAPSEKVKNELISYKIKQPIYVVPSGIYTEKFTNQQAGYLHSLLKLPQSTKIILTVGRLEREKSIGFLIESFASVYSLKKESVLVIVGEGRDKEKLQRLAVKLGIAHAVYFLGSVPYPHMPKIYADAELFIFSSQTETQGMVIIEALASGLPVVAVSDKAFDTVINNGLNGYLLSKDIHYFSQTIRTLLEDNKLRLHMSHEARKSSKAFSIHDTARVLEQIYQEVIFQKSSIQKVQVIENKNVLLLNRLLRFGKPKTVQYPTIHDLMKESKKLNF